MTTELSRPFPLERLPEEYVVEATAAECAALAERLHIVAVDSLWCRFALRRRGTTVEAAGELRAAVVQSCVVTLEPVRQEVAEPFAVNFVPAGTEAPDDDLESPDELPYEGGRIDLGEAAAQQLALALDPYPRVEGAALDEAAGEGETNPFAGLAALRRPS